MANRYARPAHDRDDEEEEDPSFLPSNTSTPPIAERHLVSLVSLGRPYKTDEEKLAQFAHLVRLKENRQTNKECADTLGVSERTIVNYLADPYYSDVQATLIGEAKTRGHLLIADVIDDAINKLYLLMQDARSEFVQYKSAEYLLKMAGYENMVEEHQRDNQADVIAFLTKLDQRKNKTSITVQINQNGPTTVDATLTDPTSLIAPGGLPDAEEYDLRQYDRPMLPGGKVPPPLESE